MSGTDLRVKRPPIETEGLARSINGIFAAFIAEAPIVGLHEVDFSDIPISVQPSARACSGVSMCRAVEVYSSVIDTGPPTIHVGGHVSVSNRSSLERTPMQEIGNQPRVNPRLSGEAAPWRHLQPSPSLSEGNSCFRQRKGRRAHC